MNIHDILEKAPQKIAYYAEKENEAYSTMITKHEEYKRIFAKKYLEKKAEGKKTIPEIEAEITIDQDVAKIKDEEILAEINYRGWKLKKNKADDLFQSAMERGRNQRTEMKMLNNTIKEE